ncbi:uncharacterized protein LOC111254225 [Varroa destructor]|uniref:Uncharacterized protein n=1 Tax=Varroa destructor TaxID=109461 RepID=A0A7M7MJB9_VARDE|nr:uncharacterized protein LOC111254225 [Varroa destructor]
MTPGACNMEEFVCIKTLASIRCIITNHSHGYPLDGCQNAFPRFTPRRHLPGPTKDTLISIRSLTAAIGLIILHNSTGPRIIPTEAIQAVTALAIACTVIWGNFEGNTDNADGACEFFAFRCDSVPGQDVFRATGMNFFQESLVAEMLRTLLA